MSHVRLELNQQELQTVLDALEARPFREVASVVMQIRGQIELHNQQQIARAQRRKAKAAPAPKGEAGQLPEPMPAQPPPSKM